jgi:hypothetical protein
MKQLYTLLLVAALASCTSKNSGGAAPSGQGASEQDSLSDIESNLIPVEIPQDMLPENWHYQGEGFIVAFNINPKEDNDWAQEVDIFKTMLQGRGVKFMELYDNFERVKFSDKDSLDLEEFAQNYKKGYLFYIPQNQSITLHRSGEYGFYSLVQLFFSNE